MKCCKCRCCRCRSLCGPVSDRCFLLLFLILVVTSFILLIFFFLALFHFWRTDTLTYEIPDDVTVNVLYTDSFYIAGNQLTGLQNLSLTAGDIELHNKAASIGFVGLTVNGPLSMKEWNSGGMVVKGNTIFQSNSDGELANASDKFTITTGLALESNRSLIATHVSCSGFTIVEGKLLNSGMREITWPAPGDSRDSGNMAQLLESGSRVPFLGDPEAYGECAANVTVRARCAGLRANYDGFGCIDGDMVMIGKCSNVCCDDVSVSRFRIGDVKKVEVFGREKVAVLSTSGVLSIYDRREIVEQIDHVMDIQAVGKDLLYSRDFVLYVLDGQNRRAVAQHVKTFTAGAYRGRYIVATDCDSSNSADRAEKICSPHPFNLIHRLSKSEMIYVVNNELVLCKDGQCQTKLRLGADEHISMATTRDNRVVFAIYSDKGIIIRKLLKNGALTHFTLSTDPVEELVLFPGPNQLPRMFIRSHGKVSIIQCQNDACIPDQVFA